MRALAVRPQTSGSTALLEVPDPIVGQENLLVRTLAIGICGTDVEITSGLYGWAAAGREWLVIGHESLGEVVHAPDGCGFAPGDLVVGIVRRPDPVPCRYCAVGEWDMCANGLYTERGIKERDGYASDLCELEPAFAVRVAPELGDLGVLVEPASVLAKAWDHAERIGRRSAAWHPHSVLVTGAGPIGLLAALMGQQRGLDVHVFDQVVAGAKADLVRELGATYHGGPLSTLGDLAPDIIIECTAATSVIADAVTRSARSGIVCLAGVSAGGHMIDLDLGGVNRRIVLENDVVFGSVNANRSHYEAGAEALARADRSWLSRLITRRVAVDDWQHAFIRDPNDIKVVLDFEGRR